MLKFFERSDVSAQNQREADVVGQPDEMRAAGSFGVSIDKFRGKGFQLFIFKCRVQFFQRTNIHWMFFDRDEVKNGPRFRATGLPQLCAQQAIEPKAKSKFEYGERNFSFLPAFVELVCRQKDVAFFFYTLIWVPIDVPVLRRTGCTCAIPLDLRIRLQITR